MALTREQVEGERFGIKLSYDTNPLPGLLQHPSYREITEPKSIPLGKIIPAEEADFIAVPTTAHRTVTLEIRDQSTNKTVDVVSLLPHQWRILVVQFDSSFVSVLRSLGQDINSPNESWRTEKRLPLFVFGGKRELTLPIYRVRRKGKGVDETAEQIVYNVGIARTVSRGVKGQINAHGEALRYLKSTFGGELLSDILG